MDIPEIPLQNPSQVIDRGQDQSDDWFVTRLTAFVAKYAADDPPEPSEEEEDMTLCTVDCINGCSMGDIFANVVYVFVIS